MVSTKYRGEGEMGHILSAKGATVGIRWASAMKKEGWWGERLTWCFWRTWASLLDTSIRLMAEIESCRRQRKSGEFAHY
jgi:hypothetical protein